MTRLSLRNVVSRLRIIVALVVLAGLLAGCSALRFGYNQAPELVFWWLDGYADFDDTQARRTRDALEQWFAWHRRTQLPDYADLLARAQIDVLNDMTPDRACRWWADLRVRGERSADQALPYAAELIPTLTPRQIQHIERRYSRINEEFRDEFLDPDPGKRLERAVKRTVERAEFVYGSLGDAQRERAAQLVADSPFDAETWYAERLQRQQETLQMLRRLSSESASRDTALAALRAHLERLVRSPREGYRRHVERLQAHNCSFVASLHNSTTATQRKAAAAKLKGWEADFRALSATPD